MPTQLWSPLRRAVATALGAGIGLILTMSGATIVAIGPGQGRQGLVLGVALWAFSVLAWYLAVAGAWGSWTLGSRLLARQRTIRSFLVLALLVTSFLISGLPILRPSQLAPLEIQSLVVLTLVVINISAAIMAISRRPRALVWLLMPAATYGVWLQWRTAASLLTTGTRYYGPASAISGLVVTLLAGSLIAAGRLAWPLRHHVAAATNTGEQAAI